MRDVAKIQKLWRGYSVRSVSQRHGSERLAELYRDPERAMKIDRAARRKQHRSAIRISAVLKGHLIRMRLTMDCDGVAKLTDPQREEKIQKAKVSKAMQKAQQAGAATVLPPSRNMRRIEDVAATRIAATMKGHLVRRRVREGQVADYLDPDRDSVIKAAKIAMWDDPDAHLIWM
jgi:DNA primase large subunit